jgi:hypothetical protein
MVSSGAPEWYALPGFGIGMTLASFQIDDKPPVSEMSFINCKRIWSADSGRCLGS